MHTNISKLTSQRNKGVDVEQECNKKALLYEMITARLKIFKETRIYLRSFVVSNSLSLS